MSTKESKSIDDSAGATPDPAVLTLDGVAYSFDDLSERLQLLSSDFVRTDQEWSALLHRYRQFLAMEATVVNHLKEEVDKAGLEPVWTSGDPKDSDIPLLTIDSTTYDATAIPDGVRLYVNDLMRNSEERSQVEFRLRQLDAARSAYLSLIREDIKSSGLQPLDPQPTTNQNAA